MIEVHSRFHGGDLLRGLLLRVEDLLLDCELLLRIGVLYDSQLPVSDVFDFFEGFEALLDIRLLVKVRCGYS